MSISPNTGHLNNCHMNVVSLRRAPAWFLAADLPFSALHGPRHSALQHTHTLRQVSCFLRQKTRINTPADHYSSSLLTQKGFRCTDFLNEKGRVGYLFRLGVFLFVFLNSSLAKTLQYGQKRKGPCKSTTSHCCYVLIFLFGREAVSMETRAFKIEDFTGGL